MSSENNVIQSTITQKTVKVKLAVEHFLQNADDLFVKADILDVKRNIETSIKELDSTVCFVMVVGPAKSGKSTFVNYMVGRDIAPTNYVECTMRPSIIRGVSDGEYIEQFFVNYNEIADKLEAIRQQYAKTPDLMKREQRHRKDLFYKECFDAVILYLKGAYTERELGRKIRINRSELTQQNLDEMLAEKEVLPSHLGGGIDSQLLVTVINIPKNELVDGNLAIIDMPGIDGAQANDEDTLYKFVSEKADHIIFIQSTVAALSNASTKYIKENIASKRGQATTLIQNTFDARWWTSDQGKMKEARTHLAIARAYLQDNGIFVHDENVINIGIAQVKKAEIVKETIHRSVDFQSCINSEIKKFNDFRDKLSKSLIESKSLMLERNVLKGTLQN